MPEEAVAEAMSLFARQLTTLFDASACLISSYDRATQQVPDWAAHVVPPAQLVTDASNGQHMLWIVAVIVGLMRLTGRSLIG